MNIKTSETLQSSGDQERTSDGPSAVSSAEKRKPQEEASARISELESQVKEKENRYLYLYADFENFKKRALKERSETQKFALEGFSFELLQVLDNLERAIDHVPAGTDKNLIEGLKMVLSQFKTILEKQGIQSVETLNRSFDPNLHESVAQEYSDRHPAETILKEHVRGYTLHGRLLRPARVTVSAKTKTDQVGK